ncbi:VOC family protein [Actinopolymorpha alba]|uniref:VOC family protein n=1 Tax=Actinopolymorpha alba TaxID=533267 RepID=UPI00035EE040|nr:VOC family protein [Actinopolymorpha alba]
MAVSYKVCIDCADPHRLAAFWAEALGYVVEDHSAFIQRLLDDGVPVQDAVTELDGRFAWRHAAAVRDPDHPVHPERGTGLGGRVLFQVVPKPKQGKNRVHLDLHHGPENVEKEVARLCELGATRIGEGQEGGSRWVVLADPEGNEFCVA